MDGWKLVLWGLLYGFGVAFVFLVLVVLRQRWGWYLLLSRDYGVELVIAAVAGLAIAWLVKQGMNGK